MQITSLPGTLVLWCGFCEQKQTDEKAGLKNCWEDDMGEIGTDKMRSDKTRTCFGKTTNSVHMKDEPVQKEQRTAGRPFWCRAEPGQREKDGVNKL